MSQTLIGVSLWLHSLATILLVGHYLLLTLIYLPVFVSNQADSVSGSMLSEISKRSRSWLYVSLLIFIVTGIYLLVVDPNYLGVGNFSNLWSILMLVKHILILGMVGLGFWYNAILRVGPQLRLDIDVSQAFNRFRQYCSLMTITGLLVLLLTAISQAK